MYTHVKQKLEKKDLRILIHIGLQSYLIAASNIRHWIYTRVINIFIFLYRINDHLENDMIRPQTDPRIKLIIDRINNLSKRLSNISRASDKEYKDISEMRVSTIFSRSELLSYRCENNFVSIVRARGAPCCQPRNSRDGQCPSIFIR